MHLYVWHIVVLCQTPQPPPDNIIWINKLCECDMRQIIRHSVSRMCVENMQQCSGCKGDNAIKQERCNHAGSLCQWATLPHIRSTSLSLRSLFQGSIYTAHVQFYTVHIWHIADTMCCEHVNSKTHMESDVFRSVLCTRGNKSDMHWTMQLSSKNKDLNFLALKSI